MLSFSRLLFAKGLAIVRVFVSRTFPSNRTLIVRTALGRTSLGNVIWRTAVEASFVLDTPLPVAFWVVLLVWSWSTKSIVLSIGLSERRLSNKVRLRFFKLSDSEEGSVDIVSLVDVGLKVRDIIVILLHLHTNLPVETALESPKDFVFGRLWF